MYASLNKKIDIIINTEELITAANIPDLLYPKVFFSLFSFLEILIAI